MDAKDYAKQIALFAILDGQYDPIEAERIISSALSAQAAEVERLTRLIGIRDVLLDEVEKTLLTIGLYKTLAEVKSARAIIPATAPEPTP